MSRRKQARDAFAKDIISLERLRHGPVELVPALIADAAGRPARPYRALDTLTIMERRGSITAGMRQAGERRLIGLGNAIGLAAGVVGKLAVLLACSFGMPSEPVAAIARPGGVIAAMSAAGGIAVVAGFQPSMRAMVCAIRWVGGLSAQ